MTTRFELAASLQRFAGGQPSLDLPGGDLAEAFTALRDGFAPLADKILSDEDRPRAFLRVFLNEEDVTRRETTQVALRDGDVVTLLPAFSGG